MYKVSIGIPVYNAGDYLERALLSALNQTLPDIEYIIVDDRGTDHSMDIVRRFMSEHPRGKDIRIIQHEVNSGQGAARDTVIANATAPYICFMDDDDEISADAIELLYNTMKQSGGVQVVQGNYKIVGDGWERVHRSTECNVAPQKGTEIIHAYPQLFTPESWNKLYDLAFLKKEHISYGGLRWREDLYFSIQVACKSPYVIYVNPVTYSHYEIATSLSACCREQRYDERRCMGDKRFYAKIVDFGLSLEGEVRLLFEQKMLELLYVDNRYALKASGLTLKEKKKFIGELDQLWHAFPFQRKYRGLKAKIFWTLYRLPIPLRIVLIRLRNLLV